MRKHKVGFFALVFLMLLLGTTLSNSNAFTEDPLFTDTIGDSSPPYTDIIDVWIDNTATHIRFKLRLQAPFNQTLANYGLWAMISVDNATGESYAGFKRDYTIQLYVTSGGNLGLYLFDHIDEGNGLTNAQNVGMAYYSFTDNNHTWEWGYKLKTYSSGKGYLNLSVGQLIYIKLEAGFDSDYAPNETAEPLAYVLEDFTNGGIPGFNLLFLGSTLITICALYFYKKKKSKSNSSFF